MCPVTMVPWFLLETKDFMVCDKDIIRLCGDSSTMWNAIVSDSVATDEGPGLSPALLIQGATAGSLQSIQLDIDHVYT